METPKQQSTMSADEIYTYWSSQAEQHGLDPASSWSDRRAIELEIEAILAHLGADLEILDAGCGTGYSSIRYALQTGSSVLGVDYVPVMVQHALQRCGELHRAVAERLDFRVGDVRDLELDSASFDRVIATRVVINLGERSEQRRALRELGRVLRQGGLLLLSEPTVQGLDRLNAFRREWGLPPIPPPAFNLYLDEETVAEDVGESLQLQALENFASSYFVATRVLKPLLARLPGVEVDVADPEGEFNRWAARLPRAGDYGTQKLFVFRKLG